MTRILCTLEDLDQTEAKEIVFDDKESASRFCREV